MTEDILKMKSIMQYMTQNIISKNCNEFAKEVEENRKEKLSRWRFHLQL